MQPYFDRTELDAGFYKHWIRPRLPSAVFDVHVHLNLPEHVARVPESRFLSDWAMEIGHLLPVDDAYACARELYPDTTYEIAGFPWPIREADLVANNAYLARLRRDGRLSPFMVVKPEWPVDEIEATLVDGRFVGFKPYPDMVTGVKGADINIFDFLPRVQWEILNRHRKAVLLHLPRKGRLADDDNIRELLTARQDYPDVTIIIAHFGRSFCPFYLEQGLKKLGSAHGFYFDTAAVINPAVYDVAFAGIPAVRILYGSDMPVTFWHGRREWTEREYHNLCREPFSWNKDRRPPEVEATYTLFLYEQMRAILDAMDRHHFPDRDKAAVFHDNAFRALGLHEPK